jgi:glutamine amidotransferase
MIAILDYGMGNLRSVQKAVERIGGQAHILDGPQGLSRAQGIVLPGVGAFGDAMAQLRKRDLLAPLLEEVAGGKPLLGICLGMQLLFEGSEEMGQHPGLGLLPGRVVRFPEGELKVPHIGWNQLHLTKAGRQSNLLRTTADGSYAYFVHSYYAQPRDVEDTLATTEYGIEFASVVGRHKVFGAQFHPEKSQEVGLQILEQFVHLVDEEARRHVGTARD